MEMTEPAVTTTPVPLHIQTFKPWRQPQPVFSNFQRTSLWTQATRTTTQQYLSTTYPTTLRQRTIIPIPKRVRVQPGTIVMMNSTYLKENYILNGLANTYHKALLMDYFELSENEMNEIGMSVVAWGFSYQVKDKPPARTDCTY